MKLPPTWTIAEWVDSLPENQYKLIEDKINRKIEKKGDCTSVTNLWVKSNDGKITKNSISNPVDINKELKYKFECLRHIN